MNSNEGNPAISRAVLLSDDGKSERCSRQRSSRSLFCSCSSTRSLATEFSAVKSHPCPSTTELAQDREARSARINSNLVILNGNLMVPSSLRTYLSSERRCAPPSGHRGQI